MGEAWHLADWAEVRERCDDIRAGGLPRCKVRHGRKRCPNPARVGYRDGLCWAHYRRKWKHGDVQAHIPVVRFKGRRRRLNYTVKRDSMECV